MLIRIIPHTIKEIPDCGSFAVWFEDGRESIYFRWDDNAGRRSILKSVTMGREEALEAAREFARKEREKLG
jgi:hypothetical protein